MSKRELQHVLDRSTKELSDFVLSTNQPTLGLSQRTNCLYDICCLVSQHISDYNHKIWKASTPHIQNCMRLARNPTNGAIATNNRIRVSELLGDPFSLRSAQPARRP
ncbi:MAG: hypothetical protein ACYC9R_06300 [Nitrosotalea sp.]